MRLLLALLLALGLAACQTAEPGPGGGDPPPGTEGPPDDGGPGDGGGDGAPPPDLAAVEVALVPIEATDEAGEPYEFVKALGVVGDGTSDLLYVMQQGGRIDVLDDGVVRAEPFLDLSDRVTEEGEAGLLGLAFHPDYPATSEVFVHYTRLRGEFGANGLWTTVSRLPVVDGRAVLEDETILFELEQPSTVHNGGQVAFGPDGLLYVALGEGDRTPDADGDGDPYTPGPPGYPAAQGPDSALGTVVRIDPAATGTDDSVPADNPSPDGAAPHVWVHGLRNPWRFSFDPLTGDLWLADVGEGRVEEVNHLSMDAPLAVRDFGWNAFEGDECLLASCDGRETVEPVVTYRTDEGERGSVTGGYVYRGDAIEPLVGAYVFGDYVRGTIWATSEQSGYATVELLARDALSISSFGVDADGELLVVDYGDYSWPDMVKERAGGLYRLVPDAPAATATSR